MAAEPLHKPTAMRRAGPASTISTRVRLGPGTTEERPSSRARISTRLHGPADAGRTSRSRRHRNSWDTGRRTYGGSPRRHGRRRLRYNFANTSWWSSRAALRWPLARGDRRQAAGEGIADTVGRGSVGRAMFDTTTCARDLERDAALRICRERHRLPNGRGIFLWISLSSALVISAHLFRPMPLPPNDSHRAIGRAVGLSSNSDARAC